MDGTYLKKIISRRWLVWSAVVLVSACVGVLLPASYTRTLEVGTDSFETHRAVFGEHTARQVVTLQRPTKAIGVVAVNLRRSTSLAPVQLRVQGEDGREIAGGNIAPEAIVDDEFAWAKFSRTLVPQTVTVELAAPQASSGNAVGIRFAEDTGSIALAVRESTPVWKRVLLWRADNPADARFTDRALTAAAFTLLVFFLAARFGGRPKVWYGLLGALVVGTVLLHVPTALKVEGTFGGDAFNFLLKAKAWIEGVDPFGVDPRRGPLLPFLLLPAYLGIDPVWLGRIVNLLSAGLAVGLTAALTARLGLPRAVALGGGILLAVNREFWWQSVHGLSNIPYAALVVASTYALVARRPMQTAAAAGLAFLTRFEGALVAAVLLPAAWIKDRLTPRSGLRMLLIAASLAVIPFLLWPLTGELGVRTADDIVDDPGLYVAWSPEDYMQNLGRFELFWGRLWLLVPLVGAQGAALAVGVLLGILAAVLVKPPWIRLAAGIVLAGLLIAGLVGTAVFDDAAARKYLTQILTILIGIGAGWLVMKRPRWALPVLLMILLQVGLVTAILPKTRYYVQAIPFAALALTVGIHTIGRIWRPAAIILLSGVIGVTYADTLRQLPGEISGYNAHAQGLAVLIEAGRALKGETGIVATGYDNLPLRVYVGDQQLRIYPEDQPDGSDSVIAWLDEVGARVVVETSSESIYANTIAAYPELFEQVAAFDTQFGEAKAQIYIYHPR